MSLLLLQVMSLSPASLSLLIKAAPILTDDMYGDVQPAAWELLLSVDEHMAAAAGESLALNSAPPELEPQPSHVSTLTLLDNPTPQPPCSCCAPSRCLTP